jgi:branched-chain amino acid transport system ATP-binding protein
MGLKVAEHVVVLEVGRLALKGTANDVKDSPELAALYLGGHSDSESEGAETAEPTTPIARRTLSKWQG